MRTPAHKALMEYQQADEEGIMVLVSRQAVHEVSDEIRELRAILTAVHKDCLNRAVGGTVPIGASVWIDVCAAVNNHE